MQINFSFGFISDEEIINNLNPRHSQSSSDKKAFSELDKRMESLAENVELLEKNVEFEISETAYVLKCSLVCIENIAVRR